MKTAAPIAFCVTIRK